MEDDKRTRVISTSQTPEVNDARTRLINNTPPQTIVQPAQDVPEDDDTPKTRVILGPKSDDSLLVDNDVFEPTVGWLVVVKGPGRGATRPIFYGMNSMGRGAQERISLDFGDSSISREAHAYVVYDDKQRDFYIQHAGKSNLVRVNEKPVLAPVELTPRDLIELGDTTLMFVPLCGDEFNWDQD